MQHLLRHFIALLALACLGANADRAFRRGRASSSRMGADPAEKEGEADGSVVDNKAFEKDWGSEWKNGDYPSFKDTVQAEDYDHKAFVDSQSDGEPSPGLTGAKVGAYLPHPLPEDYPKHGEK
mmetsp:Transcript_57809/g.129999  ORF Transcript_57809/g.129999 Transcript_57809/m.129999 type:complete len:123 (-) Transcript_57809:115-483(-)